MIRRNRFLEYRLKMGYKKQKDFAEFLGIHKYQYNKYENNTEQPSVDILYNAAKKIGCIMEDLIYYVEEEP